MKLKDHFTSQFDGFFLNFKSLTIGFNGKLTFKTVGCGCCSNEESISSVNLTETIRKTEHFLKHLKELKALMDKGDPLPQVKVDD